MTLKVYVNQVFKSYDVELDYTNLWEKSLSEKYKKLSYRRETARQLSTSFSARFTEHRTCCSTIIDKVVSKLSA